MSFIHALFTSSVDHTGLQVTSSPPSLSSVIEQVKQGSRD